MSIKKKARNTLIAGLVLGLLAGGFGKPDESKKENASESKFKIVFNLGNVVRADESTNLDEVVTIEDIGMENVIRDALKRTGIDRDGMSLTLGDLLQMNGLKIDCAKTGVTKLGLTKDLPKLTNLIGLEMKNSDIHSYAELNLPNRLSILDILDSNLTDIDGVTSRFFSKLIIGDCPINLDDYIDALFEWMRSSLIKTPYESPMSIGIYGTNSKKIKEAVPIENEKYRQLVALLCGEGIDGNATYDDLLALGKISPTDEAFKAVGLEGEEIKGFISWWVNDFKYSILLILNNTSINLEELVNEGIINEYSVPIGVTRRQMIDIINDYDKLNQYAKLNIKYRFTSASFDDIVMLKYMDDIRMNVWSDMLSKLKETTPDDAAVITAAVSLIVDEAPRIAKRDNNYLKRAKVINDEEEKRANEIAYQSSASRIASLLNKAGIKAEVVKGAENQLKCMYRGQEKIIPITEKTKKNKRPNDLNLGLTRNEDLIVNSDVIKFLNKNRKEYEKYTNEILTQKGIKGVTSNEHNIAKAREDLMLAVFGTTDLKEEKLEP